MAQRELDFEPFVINHHYRRLSFMMLDRDIVAVTLGIDMNKLVRLMGHGSKKMVYEYIEGLEEDAWKILAYFGRDFIETKAKRPFRLLEYPFAEMWSFLFHISG